MSENQETFEQRIMRTVNGLSLELGRVSDKVEQIQKWVDEHREAEHGLMGTLLPPTNSEAGK